MTARFPFSEVVGQDDAKLALTVAAVDPLIGGVLLRGHKGSAKTTLARGLAAMLGRFTELPLGTTEDRLIGTLDVTSALAGGELMFLPGLLAAADGGVLYVDEVNLLADHLVDVLLDVAVSGENLVERDGVSHRHPARFVLVGSMNPEEGELRPQLLDRFGLCVEVIAPASMDDRVEAVRRRLSFDRDPEAASGEGADRELAERIGAARPAKIGDDVMTAASRLALAAGAEGLRADLTLCRAAAALAGLEGRDAADVDDLRRIAHLVLAHRARRGPFDSPTIPPDQLADTVDDALGESSDDRPTSASDGSAPDERPLTMGSARLPPMPRPPAVSSDRGRFVRSVPAADRPDEPVAALSTVRALAARRAGDDSAVLEPQDLRTDERSERAPRLIVLCVDLSGSMGAPQRAGAATGAVLGLLDDAYQRRHRVAMVGFGGDDARLLLAPTSSVEVARNRLRDLTTGGATPLAAGIRAALDVIARDEHPDRALLVLLTDGRATGSPDAVDQALEAAAAARHRGIHALVLDCEDGAVRLGLAGSLATALGARVLPLAGGADDTARLIAAS